MDLPAVGDGFCHSRVNLLHDKGCLLLALHRCRFHFTGFFLDIRCIVSSVLGYFQHIFHRVIQYTGILLYSVNCPCHQLHSLGHYAQILHGMIRSGIYFFHIGDNVSLLFFHLSTALGDGSDDDLHLSYQIIDGNGQSSHFISRSHMNSFGNISFVATNPFYQFIYLFRCLFHRADDPQPQSQHDHDHYHK